ncbi:hypothetical protein [Cereibacter sphaeroides]|uniref:hypothetical protein n=1 Tax=Cereibacter sphaeroides TaxID=1063 RepID=UPI001F2019F8|nr:hypothetical protein [Cereibacter sphaeroides]MCE6967217.1 hypothetical protein [Cereibacter sphaeroides]
MGQTDILRALWTSARRVACAVLAGLVRRHRAEDLEKRVGALPAPEQGAIVLAVLGGLMVVSLLFAQGGVIGMLAFLLLVVLVIN